MGALRGSLSLYYHGAMKLVAVFGSAGTQPNTPAYQEAYDWGRTIAQAGLGVVTGGYQGSMEAVSHGAREAGGFVVGITAPPLFPNRSGPNVHVDLEIPAPTLLTRIERLLDVATAYAVLPGGVGTLTELMAAWNVAYIEDLHQRPRKPIAIHPVWLDLLRPAAEITHNHLDFLQVVHGTDELRSFLQKI
jgi:uncharacterized protein (TIGR00730 family)